MAQLRVSYSGVKWGWGFLKQLSSFRFLKLFYRILYDIRLGKCSETRVLRNRSRTTLAVATGFSHLVHKIVYSVVPTTGR